MPAFVYLHCQEESKGDFSIPESPLLFIAL